MSLRLSRLLQQSTQRTFFVYGTVHAPQMFMHDQLVPNNYDGVGEPSNKMGAASSCGQTQPKVCMHCITSQAIAVQYSAGVELHLVAPDHN
jgi:hypothetical protein